jgi:mono/diheme cytochrome c family protein
METLRGTKALLAVLALATSLLGTTKDPAVTPAQGESWLNHLHRNFDDTSMGKTGQLGPSEDSATAGGGVSPFFPRSSITLRGADLYRVNCRGCHGEAGTGAPPEINSVINPVRAGSLPLVLERMKQTGMMMSRAEAAAMAKESQDALMDRLRHGGKDMPAFPQLNDTEVAAILAYLRQLATVPGAEAEQRSVQESSARIGELIAKSTCHTCHSAAGANPDPEQISEGAIPPLSTLTTRLNQAEFVRKVTSGRPIVAGTPALQCRGRMPVFYYLSEEEAADVYMYLTMYPPTPSDELAPQNASVRPALAVAFLGGVGGGGSSPSAPQPDASGVLEILVGLFVVGSLGLLLAGIAFSVREIIKLSDRTEASQLQWSFNAPAREIEANSSGIADAGADAA